MANAFSDYVCNKIIDHAWRGQTWTPPATIYYAMIVATKGIWAVGTVYTTGDTIVTASPTNNRMYKATTGGTSAGSAPTWPTTSGGTVTDGTVTWTEQSLALDAGTWTEATYTGYARVAVTASLANFAGTQGAGTTAASSGTSGQTSNNADIVFGVPTSTQSGLVVGLAEMDNSTGGNELAWNISNTPVQILSGASAPTIGTAAWSFTLVP